MQLFCGSIRIYRIFPFQRKRGDYLKRFLTYFAWTIGIGLLLYQGVYLQYYFKQMINITYNQLYWYFGVLPFPIIVGMLLKLPSTWEDRGNTKWGLDWIKLTAVGIPCAYVWLAFLWMRIPGGEHLPFLDSATLPIVPVLTGVAGIVFGYILLDCIRVSNED